MGTGFHSEGKLVGTGFHSERKLVPTSFRSERRFVGTCLLSVGRALRILSRDEESDLSLAMQSCATLTTSPQVHGGTSLQTDRRTDKASYRVPPYYL